MKATFDLRGKEFTRELTELEVYIYNKQGAKVLTPRLKRHFYEALYINGEKLIASELKFKGYTK